MYEKPDNPSEMENDMEMKKPTKKLNRDTSRDYLNNREFFEEIKRWYASGEEEVPECLWRKIMLLCENLSRKYNFKDYTYIDEMKDDALFYCIKALMGKKFDPDKYDNPHAYFTLIAWRQFLKVIEKEKKESYLKHKALENYYFDTVLNSDSEQEVSAILTNDSAINRDLIEKFEKKKEKKDDEPALDPADHTEFN